MENKVCAVILAAGNGKRMKSPKPKALCEVLFKPMISWVADSVLAAGIRDACVVVGPDGNDIAKVLPPGFVTAVQTERRGTGHAVMMATDFICDGGFSDVIVLCGDAPLVSGEDIAASLLQHRKNANDVTVLTALVSDPTGYGRIVRSGQRVTSIVEQSDADEETRRINEINSGAFWFTTGFLLEALDHLTTDNAQGEYYLTDTVAYGVWVKGRTGACTVSPDAVLGANDRKGLAALNRIARERVIEKHQTNGVDIPFLDGVVIGTDVEIGTDSIILPGTILKGKTTIGKNCEIGPNSYLENAVVGDSCKVQSSYVDSSTLESGVKIGPMSNVRPGSHIRSGVKIGDFVEIKNAVIGEKTAISHLTYIGDSDVGSGCNIGCGVVTVNYDGADKHRTIIGDDAFIGCNTNLVAPVKVGNRAYSAAGTTITADVPDDALVIGRAPQVIKAGWAKKKGKFHKKK
jgi:bifunctional UDP-N-acetylglucosamine pyrophosphorylase/glucosamine-1-phosphate N-acetyltransferase